jgi:hypothetical protein
VSGIAFAAVEPGDFVYRPSYGHLDSDFSDTYALVIRRHTPPPSLVYDQTNVFRLIGWCTPGWTDYHKPDIIADFPTIKQPEEVLIV